MTFCNSGRIAEQDVDMLRALLEQITREGLTSMRRRA
jgi:hypothetical protein